MYCTIMQHKLNINHKLLEKRITRNVSNMVHIKNRVQDV